MVQGNKRKLRYETVTTMTLQSSEKMSMPSVTVGPIMNQKLKGNHLTYTADNVCVRMSDVVTADLTVL